MELFWNILCSPDPLAAQQKPDLHQLLETAPCGLINLHFLSSQKKPSPPARQSHEVRWTPEFLALLSASSRTRLAGSRTAPQTQAGNTSVRSSLSQHLSYGTSPPLSYLGVSHGWCNTFAKRFPGVHKAPWNKVWEIVRRAFTHRGEHHHRGRQELFPCPHTILSSSSKATPEAFSDAKQHEQGGQNKKK